MNIRSVVAVAPIVRDASTSASFYRDTLGIAFDGEEDVYLFTNSLEGITHFGLWQLSDAARSCFGVDAWPADVPAAQACIEFDVEDLEAAARELERAGYKPLHEVETQPWGTTVIRLISPEGLVVVVGHTPTPPVE